MLVSPSTPSLPRVGLPPNHTMGDSRQGQTSTSPSAALQQGLDRDQGSQGKGQETTDTSQHVRSFLLEVRKIQRDNAQMQEEGIQKDAESPRLWEDAKLEWAET